MSMRLAILLAFLPLLACAAAKPSGWVTPTPLAEEVGPRITIVGEVYRSELEGGFWAIRGDDGVTYDPTNLPEEFRKEGLRVEAEARRRDDIVSFHMAGPIVQLVRIRVAPTEP